MDKKELLNWFDGILLRLDINLPIIDIEKRNQGAWEIRHLIKSSGEAEVGDKEKTAMLEWVDEWRDVYHGVKTKNFKCIPGKDICYPIYQRIVALLHHRRTVSREYIKWFAEEIKQLFELDNWPAPHEIKDLIIRKLAELGIPVSEEGK